MKTNIIYSHPKWKLISKLIITNRAKNKCEICGVHNYYMCSKNSIGIILTVSHIDHNTRNNRFGNLLALCQICFFKNEKKIVPDKEKTDIVKENFQLSFNFDV
jgi:hypothetical protein